ncbi:MAG TPA: hypothetical protein VF170_16910 [Planctomycetaceae bacterium]
MAASFSDRLLEQAGLLVGADPRRPRQSNLRRAVSGAYYALFHFLVDQACRSAFGATAGRTPLRRILARGFEHGQLKEVSKAFASGTLPLWMRQVAPQLTISPDLRSIAATAVRLQEQRHRADYDLSVPFTRPEAEDLVADARDAIALWPGVADDDATRLYLAGLLCWRTLRQR